MNRQFFKSAKKRAWLLPAFLLLSLSTLLLSSKTLAETGDHNQAYLDALDTVLAARTRIGSEMTRISDGTVAHFDFLQHEHIELLRHARALRHPPMQIPTTKRNKVRAHADALLMSAEDLELVIADFLRAEAMLHSAVSNTLDLLATQSTQRLKKDDAASLWTLEESVGRFRESNTPATREALRNAFEEVASLDIAPGWKAELAVQQQLIRDNAIEATAGTAKLDAVKITELAETLQLIYLAAMAEDQ